MRKQSPYHRVYLITVWKEARPGDLPPLWRFCLEDPQTGQRRAFADAIALAAALQSGFLGSESGDDRPTAMD